MENGPDPKRAEAAADRLATPLSPRCRPSRPYAGAHLLPARALEGFDPRQHRRRCADEAYIKELGDKGFVRYGYYPHNVHFIVTSAQMAATCRPRSARPGGWTNRSTRTRVRSSHGSRRSMPRLFRRRRSSPRRRRSWRCRRADPRLPISRHPPLCPRGCLCAAAQPALGSNGDRPTRAPARAPGT